jgi:toxin-antitoxin system PIN domain toxin
VTYLLDVNVLVALLDQAHVFHEAAQNWFLTQGGNDWATCPITENGFIRVLGRASYPKGPGTPAAAARLLDGVRRLPGHSFWPEELSLFSSPLVRLEAIATAGQVTDTYLLALAVHRGGRLATFDGRLSTSAVDGGVGALAVIA